jgi:hypothetical protein
MVCISKNFQSRAVVKNKKFKSHRKCHNYDSCREHCHKITKRNNRSQICEFEIYESLIIVTNCDNSDDDLATKVALHVFDIFFFFF